MTLETKVCMDGLVYEFSIENNQVVKIRIVGSYKEIQNVSYKN